MIARYMKPRYLKYLGLGMMLTGVVLMLMANAQTGGDTRTPLGYTGFAIALPGVLLAGAAWLKDTGAADGEGSAPER